MIMIYILRSVRKITFKPRWQTNWSVVLIMSGESTHWLLSWEILPGNSAINQNFFLYLCIRRTLSKKISSKKMHFIHRDLRYMYKKKILKRRRNNLFYQNLLKGVYGTCNLTRLQVQSFPWPDSGPIWYNATTDDAIVTLLHVQYNFLTPKIGVRLIHRCVSYTEIYGISYGPDWF